MNKKSKVISGLFMGKIKNKPSKYFSEEEKRLIIEDLLSSKWTKREIWKKYTGQEEEHGQILEWMRKFGYNTGAIKRRPNFASKSNDMKKKSIPIQEEESFENLQLKKRVEELENQLKDAELRAIAFSTMVDIAEQEFNIPIRKKFNTKPLKK